MLFVFYFFLALTAGWSPAQQFNPEKPVRIATFNVSLNRSKAGQLYEDLKKDDKQAASIVCIIQYIQPDILLLNEFDYDTSQQALGLFMMKYLAMPQEGQPAVSYRYSYSAPVNTGLPSGIDLDHDGKNGGPGDAFGFGQFHGQYGMAILSKYPIDFKAVRTFQSFLWKDMPGSLLPTDWYTAETVNILRLSSKSHWDIPIQVQNQTLHVLVCHPTPPVFDGPEDRNGRRNHDEIRFWADYITPGKSGYIYDDNGKKGGLDAGSLFIIMGDMNADPNDGDSMNSAINQLLLCTSIHVTEPSSAGAVESAAAYPEFNASHTGRPQLDTYQSPTGKAPGNLRLDYIFPAKRITVKDSAVFWPIKENKLADLINASDHRMVYVDININRSH